MLNTRDILETIKMIREENLDIRTITMGISLLDCASDDENRFAEKIYDKHKTIYSFLKKIGVSDEIADEDCCKLEHAISEETFQKLKEFLTK